MLQINKKNWLKLALSSSLLLAACSPNKGHQGLSQNSINAAGIIADSTLAPSDKAERLAEAAERLLTGESFMYASEVAEQALAIDPQNRKARLISKLVAPAMEFRGVIARIEPLIMKRPADYAGYAETKAQLLRYPEKALTKFLLDGPADIQTERDAQELIGRFTARLDELRATLNDLKTGDEITLTINPEEAKRGALAKAASKCVVYNPNPYQYEMTNCDYSSAYEVKLNRADMEAIQHLVAGYQTYLTVLNAWDLTGIYTKGNKLSRSPEAAFAQLLENKNFGTLRNNQGLGVIPNLIKDAVIGTRYAMSIQNQLCPDGQETEGARDGYLFSRGICVSVQKSTERTLALIELALKGPTSIVTGPEYPNAVTVDAGRLFTAPVADIRNEAPIRFTSCGTISSVGTGTLNGLFPTGDLNRLLEKNEKECSW
jgi:hypothetical protein